MNEFSSLDQNLAANLYLDLLEQVFTRKIVPERYRPLSGRWLPGKKISKAIPAMLNRILRRRQLEIVRRYEPDRVKREQGADWPPDAETMVGIRRLDNVQACI
jgi:O-methyltransferase